MKREQINDLLYQALQTEQDGIEIYRKAIACALNPKLKKEWADYLAHTENHERILLGVFERIGLDPAEPTAGRKVVEHISRSLLAAMDQAQLHLEPAIAELVACECVVHAETKDHHNWELIGMVAEYGIGKVAEELAAAHAQVEDEEDEHLAHSSGWSRELSIQALGMPAVLPPAETEKDPTAAVAARQANP